jgi:hypothetical protein
VKRSDSFIVFVFPKEKSRRRKKERTSRKVIEELSRLTRTFLSDELVVCLKKKKRECAVD